MHSELAAVRDSWDVAAQRDAMHYIATSRSNWTPEEFFGLGREEIELAMGHLDALGLRSPRRLRALDFGCGLGRLTHALADHYKRVDGVDASSVMIDQARTLNQSSRVTYTVNTEKLPFRPRTFDLVYSNIVLQHMPQGFQRAYVGEFLRVIRPDGLAMFEIPDGPDSTHGDLCLSMYGVAEDTVREWVTDAGGEILDVETIDVAGPWHCKRYTAARS